MQYDLYELLFQNLMLWGLKCLWLIGGLSLLSIFLYLIWLLCLLTYMGKSALSASGKRYRLKN